MDRNKIKVVYLHGMGSSGESATAQRLRRALPHQEVLSPDIPVQPELAVQSLKRLAAFLGPDDIIVGTSMGGMYALLFRGWQRILVNPSFHTSEHLEDKIGQRMPFFTPRKDGAKDYEVNDKLIKKFRKLESQIFDSKFGITGKGKDSPDQVQAFFGTRDTVVNCRDEYLQHFTRMQEFDGEHRLDPDTMLKLIVPEIKRIIDPEEKE